MADRRPTTMTTTATAKRTAVKHQQWMRDPAARRQEVLKQQRQARRDLALHARQLLAAEDPPSSSDSEVGTAKRRNRRRQQQQMQQPGSSSSSNGAHTNGGSSGRGDDGMEIGTTYNRSEQVTDAAAAAVVALSKRKTREERVKQRRDHFANQLMVPEWMVDVPRDLNGRGSELGAGWYVLPRPEGKRCLVVANGGVTIARIPSGSVLKKFPSALPSGSHKTNSSPEAYCILDCIFHEHDATFYVLDVMCWKGYVLYNCTTEFRLYWLRDKLSEGSAATVSPANPFRFLPVPCFESDAQGITDAYMTTFPFLKDGLLFYMKAAQYELGLSPLALVWKDAHTSRYFVFTDKPSIVLRLGDDQTFATLEGIALFSADAAFLEQHELSEGDLAKFSFEHGYMDADQQPRLAGLAFDKRCSPQRALADSWTKILFQYNARSGGIQIQHILEAAQTSAMDAAAAPAEDAMET